MVKRLSVQVVLAVLVLFLTASAPAVVTVASADTRAVPEASAQTKKQPAKKQKKPAKKKPAPAKQAAPETPKEPWQLPMTVVIVRQSAPGCEPRCQEWIVAEGEITGATPALFRQVLKRIGKRKLPVLIQSPGGSVDAALAIGRMLRKAELDVAVAGVEFSGCRPGDKACQLPEADNGMYRGLPSPRAGFCASACPLLVAGGRQRLASPDAWIGLHQIRTTSTREHIRYRETYRVVNGKKKILSRKVVSRKTRTQTKDGLNKNLTKMLRTYLDEMGVSTGMLQDIERAPHESIYWLPSQRAADLDLITSSLADLAFSETFNACQHSPNPPRNCVTRPVRMPPPTPSQAMAVEIVRGTGSCEPFCPEWIVADGVITPDAPKQFRNVLKRTGSRKLPVFLNSTHGDFDAALEIGRMIRENGLTTAVAATGFIGCSPRHPDCGGDRASGQPFKGFVHHFGECGRECLLLLAGGIRRYAGLASGTVFAPPESLFTRAKAAAASDLADSFLKEMTIPPWVLQQARYGSMHEPVLFSPDDLLELGLATERASPAFLTDAKWCQYTPAAFNCVARPPPPPAPGEEMIVVRMRAKGDCEPLCTEWIMAQGVITRDTPERFRRLLKQAGAAKLPVVLDSKGGDLDAALEIGRMIRKRGLVTVVGSSEPLGCSPRDPVCNKGRPAARPYSGFAYSRGDCSDACLFALSGGTQRLGYWIQTVNLQSPERFATRNAEGDAKKLIEIYLREMGIASDVLSHSRSSTTLERDDMMRFHFSTGKEAADDLTGTRVCRNADPPSHCIRRDKKS